MKYFIITIDTEGDNLWDWKPGNAITTENTKFLPRFQHLANQFGFKPVWLSNYEMLNDQDFVRFASEIEKKGIGEIGMHLHAWNTPPEYFLSPSKNGVHSYLIEYPERIMREKIDVMTNLITSKIEIQPISHRAGRWATNEVYFQHLAELGYRVDCSVTPHVDWSGYPGLSENSHGTDYSNMPESPYFLVEQPGKTLLEVPVSIKKTHKTIQNANMDFLSKAKNLLKSIVGYNAWLRPNGTNIDTMKWLLDEIYNSKADYAMFMIHSSELMPGGSPNFVTNEAVEKLYCDLSALFEYASNRFVGITLRDYERTIKNKEGR